MILDPDFLTHWKTQALIGAIGAGPALTAILGLWGHCQTRKEWEFALTPRMLAGICRFTGDAEMLLAEMETCGFLDKKDGTWEVHGWAEKNASLLSSWKVGKSGGRPPKNPRVSTNAENPPPSEPTDNPQQTPGVTDKIREEKIREENTPLPPKGEEAPPPKHVLQVPSEFSEKRTGACHRWLAYKAEKRQAYKPIGWQGFLSKMAAFSDDIFHQAVEEAIANNWAGLFPERCQLSSAASSHSASEKKDGADLPMDLTGWRNVGLELYPQGNFPDRFEDLPLYLRREIVAEIKRRKGGEAA